MGITWLRGNALTLLENGTEFFPALETAIDGAATEIFLETYIFANDDTGHRIAAALSRAAGRGVCVRLLVDGFGGRDFVEHLQAPLDAAEVNVQIYRREVAPLSLRRHRLRRLHRKIAVIDGRLAFVGGINIISDLDQPSFAGPRLDYSVRIEGPLVRPIHGTVTHVWQLVAWASFRRRHPQGFAPLPPASEDGGIEAGFLIRDNLRHRRDIEDAYLTAIAEARSEIILANAYFLPGRRFRQALLEARRRGVRVTLLTQGWTDHPLQQYATRALYGQFLAHGVRIFEYHRSHLHAKVAVVDEHWATVGSSNIDPFSLLLAKEANIVVRDTEFAGQLHRSIQTAIANGAREMTVENFAHQPIHSRFMRWLSYGLVRALVGLTGYGPKHWQADEETPGFTASSPTE